MWAVYPWYVSIDKTSFQIQLFYLHRPRPQTVMMFAPFASFQTVVSHSCCVSPLMPRSTHQLSQIRRWPPHLRKRKTSLDTLQNLAGDLITHDVTLFTIMQFLASTSLVNTNHGYANRPGGLADTQTEIVVVGVDVASFLEGLYNLHDGRDERVVYVVGFKSAEELCMNFSVSIHETGNAYNMRKGCVCVPASCFLWFAP